MYLGVPHSSRETSLNTKNAFEELICGILCDSKSKMGLVYVG